jgi:opacity protein-like surface antigen
MRRLILCSLFTCLVSQAQSFNHFQGYVGGGFTTGVSDFGNRHDTGGNFLAGAGYRMTPALSLNIEYTFNHLNYGYAATTPIGGILNARYDGHTELHGFTLNPRYTLGAFHGVDTYITGGYGIYARKFQLTRPSVGTTVICDPYWFYCGTAIVPVDLIIGERTTWKQGWNAGIGLEMGGRIKFFADARYLWVANPQIRIEAIPVSFGVRF